MRALPLGISRMTNVDRLRGGRALPLGISRMTNVDRLRGGRHGWATTRNLSSGSRIDSARLRGAASGGALPPEPPAGALPLDPKMMWSHGEISDADGSVMP